VTDACSAVDALARPLVLCLRGIERRVVEQGVERLKQAGGN
jgi:hypothetical protein